MARYQIYEPQTLGSAWRTRFVPQDIVAASPEIAAEPARVLEEEVVAAIVANVEPVAIVPVIAISSQTEAVMLAILVGERWPNEGVDAHYRRKELELGALFATLTVEESYALNARVSADPIPPGDDLATRFGRLAIDRKTRLVAFLGDARRRDVSQPLLRMVSK